MWQNGRNCHSRPPLLFQPLVLHCKGSCMDTFGFTNSHIQIPPTLMLTAVPWLPFRPGMPTMRCVPPLEGWTQVRGLHWPWRQHYDHLDRKLEDPRCLEWEEQVQNVGSKFPWRHGLSTSLEVGEGRMWPRKSRTGPRARPLLPKSKDETGSRCPQFIKRGQGSGEFLSHMAS